jgi:hypothetical protein
MLQVRVFRNYRLGGFSVRRHPPIIPELTAHVATVALPLVSCFRLVRAVILDHPTLRGKFSLEEISEMRNIILMLLLFTVLGSTAAHADTLLCGGSTVCSSGGYVTEIEDLNIDSTQYNVKFSSTDSGPSPFNTNLEAADAAAAIASALGTYRIVSSAVNNTEAGTGEWYCVDAGAGVCNLYTTGYQTEQFVLCGNTWTSGTCYPTVVPNSDIGAPGDYFAVFSPSTSGGGSPVPEPGMVGVMGTGMLAICAIYRRRRKTV